MKSLSATRGAQTFGIVAALFVFKLWITSFIRTVPLYAPQDGTNFLSHAQGILAGSWLGTYSNLTLVKGPFYPLYLAAVSELGLSANVGHQLTYSIASIVACIAIAPLVRSRAALIAIGVVFSFNPLTFDFLSWLVIRSQVSGMLALLTIACASALYIRRGESVRARMPWSVGLGFSLAALWLTREEMIWIVPCLTLIAGASIASAWRTPSTMTFPRSAPLVMVPSAIWLAAILLVRAINAHDYGWNVTTEFQSPEFVAAYASLQRISTPQSFPNVPVPRSVREAAYRVSPLAQQLRPYFDGARAERGWFNVSCNAGYSCNDIAGGWFVWALRDAVAAAGYHDTGAHARLFYLGMAQQIDAACAVKTIPCDTKRSTLSPSLSGHMGDVARHFAIGIKLFATIGTLMLDPWDAHDTPLRIIGDYQFVTRDVEPIDGHRPFYDEQLKRSTLAVVAKTYQMVFPVLLGAVALLCMFRAGIAFATRRPLNTAYVIMIPIFISGAILIALLAIIDALSFPGFNNEYFGSLYPVVFFGMAIVCVHEAHLLVERVRQQFGQTAA